MTLCTEAYNLFRTHFFRLEIIGGNYFVKLKFFASLVAGGWKEKWTSSASGNFDFQKPIKSGISHIRIRLLYKSMLIWREFA